MSMNPQTTVLRTNFASGIVSPGIWNRTDWNRHASSVREAVNFLVSPTGGLRKRPGTRFLDYALPVVVDGVSYPSFLISFEFSLGQTYILEFGHYTMRFWIDDHLIIDPRTNAPYQIATPYSYFQAKEMSHAQYKDTMFCTHWDLPIQRLVRGRSPTHTNWYWELVIVEPGDLVRAPTGVRLNQNGHNGVSYAVTAVKNGQESRGGYGAVAAYDPGRTNPTTVPALSNNAEQLYVNVKAWIDRWRSQYGSLPGFPTLPSWMIPGYSTNPAVGLVDDNTYTYQYVGHNALNVRALNVIKPEVKARMATFGWSFSSDNALAYRERVADGSGFTIAYDVWYFWALVKAGEYYAFPIVKLRAIGTNIYSMSRFDKTGKIRSGLLNAGTGDPPLSDREYLINWEATAPNSNNFAIPGLNPGVRPEMDYPNFQSAMLVNAIADGTFGTTSVSTNFTYAQIKEIYDQCLKFLDDGTVRKNNIVAWNTTPGATAYNIYRNTHADTVYTGFYLLKQVPASQLTYEDPDVNTTKTQLNYSPHESGQYFDSPDTYPHVCTFFQQRLVVGSTKSSPLMIGGSTPGFFEDFLLSENPLDTTGAWRFELTSQTSNPIKHIIPLRGLYVLTEAGAFVTTSQGSINASNVNFNQEAFNGSSAVKTAIVDRSALYVPLNQQMISSLTYDYASDAFVDDNMLFTAQHLVTGTTITSIAYARPISSLVFATLADGRLLSCTFIPRQEFLGWTQLKTEGEFQQVCNNTNSRGFDEFYFTVKRNGRFLIEKMEDTRPFQDVPEGGNLFLDSALSGYFPNQVSEVTGLEHLEGLEVGAVADGGVQWKKKVVNGRIQLDAPATIVHVGLPYESKMETLDLELQSLPTLRGMMRHIVKAVVEVENTSDLTWQINDGDIWDAPLQEAQELASPPIAKTFDVAIGGACDYINGTRLKFSSRYPLPCTINSIVAEVQFG